MKFKTFQFRKDYRNLKFKNYVSAWEKSCFYRSLSVILILVEAEGSIPI